MRINLVRGAFCLALVGVCALDAGVVGAATLLSVDVNDRSPDEAGDTDSRTQAGFLSYLMGDVGTTASSTSSVGVTQTLGAYSVTMATAAGTSGTGTIDDRDRDFLPIPAALTDAEVYDDFIFNSAVGGGVRITVSGGALTPNTQYAVSLYAYDHGSAGTRTATWVDQNNADAFVLSTTFLGGTPPATDDTYKSTGIARTDASGTLSLRGFTPSGTVPTVFVSGFEVSDVPEPTGLGLVGLAGLLLARRRAR